MDVLVPTVDLSSRLIHLVMAPTHHVVTDLHAALMAKLGELRFSHRIWTADQLGRIEDWQSIASIPSRGLIVIPWFVPHAEQERFTAFEHVSIIRPQATFRDVPSGITAGYQEPIRNLIDTAVAGGYGSVVHITYRDISDHRDDLAQFISATCLQHGLRTTLVPIFADWSEAEQVEAEAALQGNGQILVICAADFTAHCVRKLILRMGGSIPSDFAIAGFYDTPWSQVNEITTIGLRPARLAELAIQRLQADEFDPTPLRVAGELILRSTGPLPVV